MDSLLLYTIIGEIICIATIGYLLKDIKITKTVKGNETETKIKSDEYR